MRRMFGLVGADAKNTLRDQTLLFVTSMPLLLGLIIRFLVPWLAEALEPSFDLSQYYIYIIGALAVYPPMTFGWVTGFMLLDERDENILTAVSVTPLSKNGYLIYRMVMPVLLSCLVCYVTLFIAGLIPLSAAKLLPVAIISSLGAPITALFMVAFAGNKVEGIALSKAVSLLYVGPLVVVFIKSDWQYLAGVVPTFWVSRAFVSSFSDMGEYWMGIVGGLAVSMVFLVLLLRRFNAQIG